MVFTQKQVDKLKELRRKFKGRAVHGEDGTVANVDEIYFDMDRESLVVVSEQRGTLLKLDCSACGKMIAMERLEKLLNES